MGNQGWFASAVAASAMALLVMCGAPQSARANMAPSMRNAPAAPAPAPALQSAPSICETTASMSGDQRTELVRLARALQALDHVRPDRDAYQNALKDALNRAEYQLWEKPAKRALVTMILVESLKQDLFLTSGIEGVGWGAFERLSYKTVFDSAEDATPLYRASDALRVGVAKWIERERARLSRPEDAKELLSLLLKRDAMNSIIATIEFSLLAQMKQNAQNLRDQYFAYVRLGGAAAIGATLVIGSVLFAGIPIGLAAAGGTAVAGAFGSASAQFAMAGAIAAVGAGGGNMMVRLHEYTEYAATQSVLHGTNMTCELSKAFNGREDVLKRAFIGGAIEGAALGFAFGGASQIIPKTTALVMYLAVGGTTAATAGMVIYDKYQYARALEVANELDRAESLASNGDGRAAKQAWLRARAAAAQAHADLLRVVLVGLPMVEGPAELVAAARATRGTVLAMIAKAADNAGNAYLTAEDFYLRSKNP